MKVATGAMSQDLAELMNAAETNAGMTTDELMEEVDTSEDRLDRNRCRKDSGVVQHSGEVHEYGGCQGGEDGK